VSHFIKDTMILSQLLQSHGAPKFGHHHHIPEKPKKFRENGQSERWTVFEETHTVHLNWCLNRNHLQVTASCWCNPLRPIYIFIETHEEVACGGRMVWSVHTENLENETSTNTNLTRCVWAHMHAKHGFSYNWKTQIEGLQKRVLKIHRPEGGNKGRAQKSIYWGTSTRWSEHAARKRHSEMSAKCWF